jgi:hypothetical protein
MSTRIRIILLVLLLCSAIGGTWNYFYKSRTAPVKQDDQAFVHTMQTAADFKNFAGAPLDNAYPDISSVKAVYDLDRKEIYYVNSNMYRLHFDFCSKVLGYKLGLRLFNIANYGSDRDYYLANINYLRKSNSYVLEFGMYDEIDSVQITEMFHKVSESPLFKNNLRLLLNNTNSINYFSNGKSIPTCNPNELNDGLGFQSIQSGTCTGRLVVCDDLKAQYLTITPDDIVVLKGSPTDIPLCKAIISDCFQTPLSHIQVLSHNKKMPSAYLATVFENSIVKQYNGQYVKLEVRADTLLLTPASLETRTISLEMVELEMNTSIHTLVPIDKCAALTNADIGTKAKGFSDLKQVADKNFSLFRIPEGAFVIPFYFFRQHLQQAKIAPLLDTLQRYPADETRRINELLQKIRNAIEETPVAPELLQQVETQIRKNNCGTAYRFRSSSNAEDLSEFSGAGLYTSKTGDINSRKKTIERAIRKVWASTYNYRAYQERSYSQIDENTVGMSILAHRNFPEEDINGVIITKNNYRTNYPGLVINAQLGDISTVSPPDSVRCEQLILTENKLMNPFSKKVSAKYICFSSLHPEGPLLRYQQLLQLQQSTRAVQDFYAERKLDWDIEFKFEGGILYFKQVRPYR